MNPHPHKSLILEWADGSEVEAFDPKSGKWVPANTPRWEAGVEYRIKPDMPMIETKMTEAELAEICHCNGRCMPSIKRAANAAIARAIADGQVVTKEEYDRVKDQLTELALVNAEQESYRAARDMAVAKAVIAYLDSLACSISLPESTLADIIAKVKLP